MPEKQISEKQLHQQWKNLRPGTILELRDGRNAVLIHPGVHNHSDGPDFFLAQLKLDGLLLFGHVEIHINENDWLMHKHQDDPRYQNVILHVFIKEAKKNLIAIPAFIFPEDWLCIHPPKELNLPLKLPKSLQWLEDLGLKRLNNKANRLSSLAAIVSFDLPQLFFINTMRAYGLPYNTEAMEIMALQLPYRRLLHTEETSVFAEAYLCGMAGFLTDSSQRSFPKEYYKEWEKVQNKYQVTPMQKSIWRYSSARPYSHPVQKLIQAAAFLHFHFTKGAAIKDLQQLLCLDYFAIEPSEIWQEYIANKRSLKAGILPGEEKKKTLVINGIIPYVLYYSNYSLNQDLENQAIEALKKLPAEKNKIVLSFCLENKIAFEKLNALSGQGILAIKKKDRSF